MIQKNSLLSKLMPYGDDVLAGSSVFLVALPLCLGIALASDAPIVSGILAGIVGGILVGLISGSHTSVSGPAAGLTAVVATEIASLGSFEAFLAALVMAGLIQIAFGIARIGNISEFFPSSVMSGLLAAIGIILTLKQLPHLVGWDVDAEGEMAFMQMDQENTFSEIGRMFFHIHEGAFVIGLISLLIMLLWEKIDGLKNGKIPSSVVVVFVGIIINMCLPLVGPTWKIGNEHRVQVPVANDFFGLMEFVRFPDVYAFFRPEVYGAAFVLALIASLETMLNLGAVDKIDPYRRRSPANRELVAQGIGNTLLGLVGGLPTTSVIVRSSVNINARAKTKVSTIAHGFLLLFSAIFFPTWLNTIPLSCLAAILIATGLKLVSPNVIMEMWRKGINQFLPFVITIIAIVFSDLLIGALVGLAASIAFIIMSNLKNPLQLIREKRATFDLERVVLANQVSFLNRLALKRVFDRVPDGGHVLIDASQTDYIDSDILNLIRAFKKDTAQDRNVTVSLVGFKKNQGLENEVHYTEHATPQLQKSLSPSDVLQILKEGNERVLSDKRLQRDLTRQITATAQGQFPYGVILSCMDSRAPVELIFDLGIGDIFSVRMAGNTVSERVLGSLEFACKIAGAKLIVVMGHTRCGAVSASIDFFQSKESIKDTTGCQHLSAIVGDIHKVIAKEKIDGDIPKKGSSLREAFEQRIITAHVRECISNILKQSATINQLVEENHIDIVGCIYDVRTGHVDFMPNENGG